MGVHVCGKILMSYLLCSLVHLVVKLLMLDKPPRMNHTGIQIHLLNQALIRLLDHPIQHNHDQQPRWETWMDGTMTILWIILTTLMVMDGVRPYFCFYLCLIHCWFYVEPLDTLVRNEPEPITSVVPDTIKPANAVSSFGASTDSPGIRKAGEPFKLSSATSQGQSFDYILSWSFDLLTLCNC